VSNGAGGLVDKLKNLYQNNPKLVRIAIVAVVALVIFSYAALEFTSRPGFCINCHEMKPAFDQWKTSVHAEVTCYDCHMEPGIVNLLVHKVKAVKELYLHLTVFSKPNAPKIHAKELKPINEACGKCHSFKRELSFSGDLRVPHELHMKKGLQCPTCHSKVVHGKPEDRKPKMEVCLTCHDGRKAPDKCGACHTKKAVPENHKKSNWFKVHGAESKTMNCATCHNWRPDWCMSCHKKKPQSHLVLWRTNHGEHAGQGCKACHLPNFCMRCHGIPPLE